MTKLLRSNLSKLYFETLANELKNKVNQPKTELSTVSVMEETMASEITLLKTEKLKIWLQMEGHPVLATRRSKILLNSTGRKEGGVGITKNVEAKVMGIVLNVEKVLLLFSRRETAEKIFTRYHFGYNWKNRTILSSHGEQGAFEEKRL